MTLECVRGLILNQGERISPRVFIPALSRKRRELYQVWESEGELQIETTREVFKSIRLILSLRRKNLLNQMSWAYATPYPGSDLYRVCKKFNLLPGNFEEALISSDRLTIPVPGLSKREVAAARLAGLSVQALLNLSNREQYDNLRPTDYEMYFPRSRHLDSDTYSRIK